MGVKRMWFVAAVPAAIVVCGATGVCADDRAAAILTKYTAFMGWTLSDRSMTSLRITGTVENVAWSRVSRGTAYRETLDVPAVSRSESGGFSGTRFWRSGVNGFPVPLEQRARTFAMTYARIMGNALSDLPGTLRDDADPGDAVVRVEPPGGVPADLVFDRAGGRLVRAVIDPDAAPTTLTVDRYADAAPGKKVIAEYHVGTQAHVIATGIAANVAVQDADLAPPAPVAEWTFGSATPIPIDRIPEGVEFAAEVNGVRGHFLLDTGASSVVLTEAFARRAHLTRLGEVKALTTTGAMKVWWSTADRLTIGDHTLRHVALQTGLGALGALDGLMGFDAVAGAIVEVDLRRKQLALFDPATYQPNGGSYFELPVDLSLHVPFIPATFGGDRTGYMMIDSGNRAETIVSYDLRDVLHGPRRLLTVGGAAGGNVVAQLQCGDVETIAVEKLRWHDSIACLAQSPGRNGILGFGFLSRFNWLLDYPEARIYLQHNP